MGDDGACDRGAVRMRLLVGVERVETIHDHARELGMSEVDAGIDHRDQHLVALSELVRLPQAQLGRRVLPRVALAEERGGRRLALGRQLLLELVDVVWLRGQNDAFGLQGVDDRRHGAPVGNPPAGHGDVVGGEGCDAVEAQPPTERVDGLVGHA